MKYYITVLALILTPWNLSADNNDKLINYGGVIVDIKAEKIAFKSGESIKFQGTIRVLDSEQNDKKSKTTLLAEFQKMGLAIVGSFPSDVQDISKGLEISSTQNEISFSYSVTNLRAEDLNQFSIKVFDNHENQSLLSKLAKIKSKLDRRTQALVQLQNSGAKEKWSLAAAEYVAKKTEQLQKISTLLEARMNTSVNLLAENRYALQVDNLTAAPSKIAMLMKKFKFVINAEIGSVIEGGMTRINASVTNLRGSDSSEAEQKDDEEEFDGKVAKFEFNGINLFTSKPQELSNGKSISYDFTTQRLLPSNSNRFSISLYKSEKLKSKHLIGTLNQNIPVASDVVPPKWLTSAKPTNSDMLYVKKLELVDLQVADTFGRIDSEALSSRLTGTLNDGSPYLRDAIDFAKLKVGDGWSYGFTTDVNPLAEGVFKLTASVKDLALNFSVPNPYTINFSIDRTNPAVLVGINDSALTNQLSYQVPIKVDDTSPVATEVFVNDGLQLTTSSKFFTATLNLNLEGANLVKVVSTDAAGNRTVSNVFIVTRDTTPPELTFLSPIQGEAVDGFYFNVSCRSNEPVTDAKLNGDKFEFTGEVTDFQKTFSTTAEGDTTLVAEATDKAGNVGRKTINIYAVSRPLNQSLIGLYVDEPNNKVIVKGAVGSTRPNYQVKVSSGFFSSETVQAQSDGSFMISMNAAPEYKVSVYDHRKNITVSFSYLLGSDNNTILSGTVRDTDNFPLVYARVAIMNTQFFTQTDDNGVFVFSRKVYPTARVTGDQVLVIDGSDVKLSAEATPRKFSTTSVAITIGVSQSNILQTPIYIAPMYLDGSATNITSIDGGRVSDVHAPGVELNIPPGATIFPDGRAENLISLQAIPAARSTVPVPEWARPSTVIALEPSGAKFTQPVQLTLPNVNNFPPTAEMVILLMNSKTGRWEIGGAATVSPNGQSIVTKPNQGIRHFSLAYATIAGPNIRPIGAQDRPGADTFNGALTTQIDLPSFKNLGSEISPKLIYKSSWAKPSALVTNLFDFANTKVNVSLPPQTSAGVESYLVNFVNCTWPFYVDTSQGGSGEPVDIENLPSACQKDPKTFYDNIQYETKYTNVTSQIQPERVEASLITNNLVTDKIKFANIPHMANISFGVDLITNQETKQYFETGVYPYRAHYDIYFKELTMGTYTSKYWSNNISAQTTDPKDFKELSPEKVFGQDLIDSIYVQNYRNSEAGAGWRIAGFQRIVNPKSDKIMIEEEDGSLATYGINNTIQTVIDVGSKGGDLKNGVALNNWPDIAVPSASNSNQILNISFSSQSASVIGTNYDVSGSIKGFDFYNYTTSSCYQERYCSDRRSGFGGNVCVAFSTRTICNYFPNSSCTNHASTFNLKAKPTAMLNLSGRVIGVDSNRHSVFDLSSSGSIKLLGAQSTIKTFANNYETTSETQGTAINNFCNSTSGLNCSNSSRVNSSIAAYNACAAPTASNNQFPYSESDAVINGQQALNSPMGIAASPSPDVVAIADYGFHKVRWLNIATGETGIIAGNGQASDLGNGEWATNASIKHPKGLVYDSAGNLYISSDSGYIRKVDTNGVISIAAGDPINGVLANESEAKSVLFNQPNGLALDQLRNYLYVADSGHNRIIRIDLNSNLATTVAGSGQAGFSGDGGSAIDASINNPTQLGLDSNGNLLIADSGNNRIRRVVFQNTSQGILSFIPTVKNFSTLTRDSNGTWVRTQRDGTIFRFSTNGYQTNAEAPDGKTVSYAYDNQNRLTKIVMPNSDFIEYSYSGKYLRSITDPAGRTTQFSFDYYGNLTDVTYPDNTNKKFEYSADNLMVAEVNQRNSRQEYAYNVYNRIVQITGSDSLPVKINDSGSNNLTNFDSATLSTPKNLGMSEQGLSESVKDPSGNTTTVAKDIQGYIYSIKDAKGRITTIKRDTEGRPTEITNVDGSITKNTYDSAFGDLIETRNVNLDITVKNKYNKFGQVVSETDPYERTSTKEYNNKRQLIKQVSIDGKYAVLLYNSIGMAVQKSLFNSSGELQRQSNYEYNAKGDLVKQSDQTGKYLIYSYNLVGNVISASSNISGAEMATTYYEYDLMNNLTKVISPNSEITEYFYSVANELQQIKDPKGKLTSFEYNLKGQLIKKIDPQGQIYEMSYDANGNLASEKDPNQNLKSFRYNELNKITSVALPDDLISYDYNNRDEVVAISGFSSTINYSRDLKQRIVQEAVTGVNYPSHTVNYDYNKKDMRTGMQSNFISLSYGIDSSDRLTEITNSHGELFKFNYDEANRLLQIVRPGSASQFTYGLGSELTSITHLASGNVKSFSNYQYDQRNYITQKRNLAGTFDYSYDKNGQLIKANSQAAPAESETFSYDSVGNRLISNDVESKYDGASRRIIDDGSYVYAYDNNGNIIYKSSKLNGISYSFQYLSTNQLKKVVITSMPLGGDILKILEYRYDPVGRRIERSVQDAVNVQNSNTKRYYYDGQNIITETDANNRLVATYTHSPLRPDDVLSAKIFAAGVSSLKGGNALSEGHVLANQTGTVYYLKDHSNSITDILDSSGNTIQTFNYSSYGTIRKIKDQSGSAVQFADAPVRSSYTFTGREYEPELGMYYYRARYYDPNTGRFLQQDPDPGKLRSPNTFLSKYIYAVNNPIMFSDPNGRNPIAIIAVIVGAIVGGIIGAQDRDSGHGSIDQRILRGAIAGAIFAVAFILSSTTAGLGLIVSISKAGSQKGDFWNNLNKSFLQDALFALVGSYLTDKFIDSELRALGNFGGANGIVNGITNSITAVITNGGLIIAVGNAIRSIRDAGCGEGGSWVGGDLCR